MIRSEVPIPYHNVRGGDLECRRLKATPIRKEYKRVLVRVQIFKIRINEARLHVILEILIVDGTD